MKLSTRIKEANIALARSEQSNYASIVSFVVNANDIPESVKAKVLGHLRARRWKALLDVADELTTQQYWSPAEHYAGNQLAALIRKYPFNADELKAQGIDPEKSAWEKFVAAEKRCERYNRYFRLRRNNGAWRRKGRVLRNTAAISFMRRWIEGVIGAMPPLQEIYDRAGFGPGASIGVTGDATNFAAKLAAETWSVTAGASFYAAAAICRSHPQIREYLLCNEGDVYPVPHADLDLAFSQVWDRVMARCTIVDYNKIMFVPKTTAKHRSIAVEPLLNGWIQKGVDETLRLRLRRVGIDLRDQGRNQELARIGSEHWLNPESFCTIDLSSASDSMCIELVREIVPPGWFELLNSLRSHNYVYGNEKYRYHKFVSMGNGFCFPLQTLIFASICQYALHEIGKSDGIYSVYGDDIIVHRSVFPRVLELLRMCGFRPNPEKTFSEGPFRESCGKDYFGGWAVRPISLDYALDSLESIFKFHNAIRETENNPFQEDFFTGVREVLRALVPHKVAFMRPHKGQPDTAFEVEKDVFMASRYAEWNQDLQTWQWKELLHRPVRDTSTVDTKGYHILQLMAALQGSDSKMPFTLRRKVRTTVRMVSHGGSRITYDPHAARKCRDGQLHPLLRNR